MDAKNERFGNGQTECKVCGRKLEKLRELKLEITHKSSGSGLCALWYAVPLCDKCGGNDSLNIDLSWEADQVDADSLMG